MCVCVCVCVRACVCVFHLLLLLSSPFTNWLLYASECFPASAAPVSTFPSPVLNFSSKLFIIEAQIFTTSFPSLSSSQLLAPFYLFFCNYLSLSSSPLISSPSLASAPLFPPPFPSPSSSSLFLHVPTDGVISFSGLAIGLYSQQGYAHIYKSAECARRM